MSGVKVSVVIPTYNRGQYILESVGSVLNQSFNNCEVIVIDDGSTDDTRTVIEGIDDQRVVYLPTDHSGRPSVPRNVGLNVATGKYIAFLDSDDLWLPEKLSLQVPLMEQRTDIDISYGNVMTFDQNSDKGIEIAYPFNRNGNPKYRLLFKNFIPSITVLMRRSFLEKNHLRFKEELESVEDYELWLRSAIYGANFYFINRILARHRLHEHQLSAQSNDKKAIKMFLRDLPYNNFYFQVLRKLAIMKLEFKSPK
jgi:glycosyltransferase involved in cell wall biosynthesis